ncbi:hypothetical protein FACS1894219_12470 [Clostridia bacterium]|nr:hypothetical protein FACS1894219_12470 [Clostridia bacterium]
MDKHKLSQLYYLNKEIVEQQKRLTELESSSTDCSVRITGMPHGTGISDKVGNYAAEIADLKALMDLNLKKCFYALNCLNRYIGSVQDSQMRMILSLRYISGYNWLQIAMTIGGGNTADSTKKAAYRFLNKVC